MSPYDVIIVGGGHNGLVAASYLAGRGLRTLVLETRSQVGGACVTEEITPGHCVSTLAYAVSLIPPRIMQDLDLKAHGLEILVKDPQYFVPYPDGSHLFLWVDAERTVKEIRKFSSHDAAAYVEFTQTWERFSQVLDELLLKPPPDIHKALQQLRGKWTLASRFLRGKLKDVEGWTAFLQRTLKMDDFWRLLFLSVKDHLDETFESEHIKAALATQGLIGFHGGPMSQGTALIMGYHHFGQLNGQRGVWGFARGGMGAVANAIAHAAQKKGAHIRVGAEVERILVKDGKTHGVALKSGETIHSRLVVSNVDPKRTFLQLVESEHLDPAFRRGVQRLKSEGVSMKVNCVLDRLPEFTCYKEKTPGPQHACTTGICPSIDYLEKAWDDAKYGRPSQHPFLEALIHTVLDPSLAPSGRHTLSIFAQYAPYTLSKGNWDDLREEYGRRIIETYAEYAPNVLEGVVHKQVLTPLDLERQYHLTGGHIFHIEMSIDQMFTFRPLPDWCNYRTPIANLYLCGSGVHPGGGVTGAPGYNCAQTILRDLKLA